MFVVSERASAYRKGATCAAAGLAEGRRCLPEMKEISLRLVALGE